MCISLWHFDYYFLKPLFKAIIDILLFKCRSAVPGSINSYDLMRTYHMQVSRMETLYTILFNCQNTPLSGDITISS